MLQTGLLFKNKVRPVRQTEMAECGLACLLMVASYYGFDADLTSMRRRFRLSMRGATLKSLITMADNLGFSSRALKVDIEQIEYLQTPAILHWDLSHFVVVERFQRKRALIHNPDGRSRWMSLSEISGHFTGIALELQPTTSFSQSRRASPLKLNQLWSGMHGTWKAISQIALLSIVLQAYVIVYPYYLQVAVDSAVPSSDTNLLLILALGFGIFTIMNAGASLLRSFVIMTVGSNIGFTIASNIARHLFRLPTDWFERRHAGDILSRFQSVTPIQTMLSQGGAAAILDGTMALLTLVMMFFYNVSLAFISLTSFILYVLVRILTFYFERNAKERSIVAHGVEQTTLIETIQGITTLRLLSGETERHALWRDRLVDAVNSDIRSNRITIWQATANTLIFGLENVVSGWLAIRLVMAGDSFSLGMIFAYIAYKAQFIQKTSSFLDQAVMFRMLRLHLDRLSDIALTEEDKSFARTDEEGEGLKGRIELRDVYFRYSQTDPYILDGVNLVIEPAENVAITGPSGAGKSTLLKIILGLLEPTQGELLIDNTPIRIFGYRRYRCNLSAVLQEDTLFSGTIADNISAFDQSSDLERICRAAQLASIHDDIQKMPMRYETLVGDMGSTLSGGQKQRVLLARALYRNPSLLVMDEGTAHLDAVHEEVVSRSIRELGITRILVAHRAETLATADRRLKFVDGQLHAIA